MIGIGEFAITTQPDAEIVTHALGSCVAVCLWDPVTKVAGMLHFLLPESKLNAERAARQPGTFADTGIPLLFQAAYKAGAVKARLRAETVSNQCRAATAKRQATRMIASANTRRTANGSSAAGSAGKSESSAPAIADQGRD